MITRRAFLSALAALPFVGKLIPQDGWMRSWPDAKQFDAHKFDPWVPMTFEEQPLYRPYQDGNFVAPSWDEVQRTYALRYGSVNASQHPMYTADIQRLRRLTFAEWDRLHQV